MAKVTLLLVVLLALGCGSVLGQKQRGVIVVKPNETRQIKWVTSPPPSDVVLCCGGSLVMSWTPMDGGVDRSVAVNNDPACPTSLQNQRYVTYVAQAAPRGLVTINTKSADFAYDGDYYVSSTPGQQCQQGMQFVLAIRGCGRENPTYTAQTQVPWQTLCAVPQPTAANATAANANVTAGAAGAAGQQLQLPEASPAPKKSSAGAAGVAVAAAAATAAGVAVLLL